MKCSSGTLKTEYAFHQVCLFSREPSQGFAMIGKRQHMITREECHSAGSDKNLLQMPGLHPAAAMTWTTG